MTKSEHNYLVEKERVCGLDDDERYRLSFEEVEDDDTVDEIVEQAKKDGVFEEHRDCYQTMSVEDFGNEVVVPYLEDEGYDGSNIMELAGAYINAVVNSWANEDGEEK